MPFVATSTAATVELVNLRWTFSSVGYADPVTWPFVGSLYSNMGSLKQIFNTICCDHLQSLKRLKVVVFFPNNNVLASVV